MNAKANVLLIAGIVAIGSLMSAAHADPGQMQLPRVEHGQLISPAPTPPPPTFPRVEGGWLRVNPNVSVNGGLNPPQVSVQVPLPEKKPQ
jgi:hypothetical protein